MISIQKWRCTVCGYIYDEAKEGRKFSELPEDYRCPVCNAEKSAFVVLTDGREKMLLEKQSTGKTVSDLIVEQMAAWGVKYVYGIIGGSILGVTDSIRRHPKIKFIPVRHEQTAAMMASAYAKLTDEVGVCLAIAGPGATNLITGLYDAKMDRAPVLALTGQVKLQYIGPGDFQEIDQDTLFEPICVFNKTINSGEQTTSLVTLAVKHAIVDRGVSHLSIPNDVQKEFCSDAIKPMEGRISSDEIHPKKEFLMKAVQMINHSARPVIIAGWGCRKYKDMVKNLANKISAPIATTFRGKGIVDEDSELSIGVLGDVGSLISREIVNDSDLLIVLGSSFSEKTNIPHKKIIHIDIDRQHLGKTFPVELALWGNMGSILPRLITEVESHDNQGYLSEMRKKKEKWNKLLDEEAMSNPMRKGNNASEYGSELPLNGPFIMRTLSKLVEEDAIITIDVGDNGFWFGRNFKMKAKQDLLMSGYLGTMGFGLPAALAAKIAEPNRRVYCVTGDGGFTMVMGDFLTAVKEKLNIIVIVLNNRELAMISAEQLTEEYPKFATELNNPSFADYANSCGGLGVKVKHADELIAAVEKAKKVGKPVIIDIDTSPKRF